MTHAEGRTITHEISACRLASNPGPYALARLASYQVDGLSQTAPVFNGGLPWKAPCAHIS